MSSPVGIYEHSLYGEKIALELWKPEDFAAFVREEPPREVACGVVIVSPDIEYLAEERAHYDSEVSMIPSWAEDERNALVVAKLLRVSVLDSRIPGLFWLKSIPEDAPQELVEKLQESN